MCGFYTRHLIPEGMATGDRIAGWHAHGGVVIIRVRLIGTGYYKTPGEARAVVARDGYVGVAVLDETATPGCD